MRFEDLPLECQWGLSDKPYCENSTVSGLRYFISMQYGNLRTFNKEINCGTSSVYAFIANYKKGTQRVDTSLGRRIAAALGVSLAQLRVLLDLECGLEGGCDGTET